MLTRGNHKLPRTIGIFNLPHRVTCPGATEECKKYCYARKAEVQYKQVIPYRYRNLELSKQKDFVERMCEEISHTRTMTAVRIHESGDFYNQAYVDKWAKIAKTFPHIQFTFYTKSFHLFDFSELRRLKNVTAFASVDPTTPSERLTHTKGWKKATVIENTHAPKGFFMCTGDCHTCSHCYKHETTSVAFKKH